MSKHTGDTPIHTRKLGATAAVGGSVAVLGWGLIAAISHYSAPPATAAPQPAVPTTTITAPVATPSTSPSTTPSPTPTSTTKAPVPTTKVVHIGKAFTLGRDTVQSGWKVSQDDADHLHISGKAKNTSSSASTPFIHIKFLNGSKVVATATCTTDKLEPGKTLALKCSSGDTYTTKFDKVTAEATF